MRYWPSGYLNKEGKTIMNPMTFCKPKEIEDEKINQRFSVKTYIRKVTSGMPMPRTLSGTY